MQTENLVIVDEIPRALRMERKAGRCVGFVDGLLRRSFGTVVVMRVVAWLWQGKEESKGDARELTKTQRRRERKVWR